MFSSVGVVEEDFSAGFAAGVVESAAGLLAAGGVGSGFDVSALSQPTEIVSKATADKVSSNFIFCLQK